MGSNSKATATATATVATVGDLLHRMASSCLSQRLPGTRTFHDDDDDDQWSGGGGGLHLLHEEEEEAEAAAAGQKRESGKRADSIARAIAIAKEISEEEEEEEEQRLRIWEEDKHHPHPHPPKAPPAPADASAPAPAPANDATEMEALLAQVFGSVSAVKRAYRSLQHAQCPWDPSKLQAADAALVSELRKLDRLRDRYRRSRRHANPTHASPPPLLPSLRDAVAPYEAALDDLKKELKLKEAEVHNLRQKLDGSGLLGATASRKGRSHSARWAGRGFSKGVGVGVGNYLAPSNTSCFLPYTINMSSYCVYCFHELDKSTNSAQTKVTLMPTSEAHCIDFHLICHGYHTEI